jgi:predicted RNA polymerase sigma factor
LEGYPYFDAVRGELLRQAGELDAAKEALQQGLWAARNSSERDFLQQKLSSLI